MIKSILQFQLLCTLVAVLINACATPTNSIQRKSALSNNSSSLRSQVEKEARRQIGTRYRYGGKTPKGFDCSGFTKYVYDKVNVELAPSSTLQSKQGKQVNLKWAKKGDLLFFGKQGRIHHVALIISNSKNGIQVIHSTSSRGVVEENVHSSAPHSRRRCRRPLALPR